MCNTGAFLFLPPLQEASRHGDFPRQQVSIFIWECESHDYTCNLKHKSSFCNKVRRYVCSTSRNPRGYQSDLHFLIAFQISQLQGTRPMSIACSYFLIFFVIQNLFILQTIMGYITSLKIFSREDRIQSLNTIYTCWYSYYIQCHMGQTPLAD